MKFSEILNVGLIPVFVIVSGLIISSRRKRRSRNAEITVVKENSGDV